MSEAHGAVFADDATPLTMDDFEDGYTDPSALARLLGGSVRAWQRACERGLIRAVRRPGGGWSIPVCEIKRWIRNNQNVMNN